MAEMNCTKVTLSSGKVVILRAVKIRHTELAAQEVAPRSGGDANLLQILMTKALVKQLILEVEGQKPSASDLEDMDSLFTVPEYSQVLGVVQKLTGGSDMGKSQPQIEAVLSGDR